MSQQRTRKNNKQALQSTNYGVEYSTWTVEQQVKTKLDLLFLDFIEINYEKTIKPPLLPKEIFFVVGILVGGINHAIFIPAWFPGNQGNYHKQNKTIWLVKSVYREVIIAAWHELIILEARHNVSRKYW